MTRAVSIIAILLASISVLAVPGCSDVPKAPPRFQLDPQQAAKAAMKLYDTNGDGKLDASELQATPPLAALLRNVKAANPDHPDCVTEQEIADRLEQWQALPTTLVCPMIMITLDGNRLEGATVTFEPEPFLGPSYHSHRGQTAGGTAVLDQECEGFPGVYVGLYRIRVSKVVDSKETIPARYNAETVLGIEATTSVVPPYGDAVFDLKSK
jgi:hypothetical protein